MKLFEAIIKDKTDVMLVTGTATNKTKFKDIYGGNGEFIKITDITNNYLNEYTIETLENDLHRCGWGSCEIQLITALVQEHINKRG